jgi:hypothetical protein
MSPSPKRWFFVPGRDGRSWDLVEASRVETGWEIRRPGRIAQEVLSKVPPKDEDWHEVEAPKRAPRLPEPAAPPAPRTADGARGRSERPPRPASAKPLVVKAPAEPARKPKPVPPKAIPGLSRELEDMMLDAQRKEKAPAGMVKCPLCGLILEPMRGKKVRTHDNPVKGVRCEASGKPMAD